MPLKVTVLDVNDNSPEIVDPQGDVVSVREEQPPGTEVARIRALDSDLGENASVTYTILKGKSTLNRNPSFKVQSAVRYFINKKHPRECFVSISAGARIFCRIDYRGFTINLVLRRPRLGRLQCFHR